MNCLSYDGALNTASKNREIAVTVEPFPKCAERFAPPPPPSYFALKLHRQRADVHEDLLSCMNHVFVRGCEAEYLGPLVDTRRFCPRPPETENGDGDSGGGGGGSSEGEESGCIENGCRKPSPGSVARFVYNDVMAAAAAAVMTALFPVFFRVRMLVMAANRSVVSVTGDKQE